MFALTDEGALNLRLVPSCWVFLRALPALNVASAPVGEQRDGHVRCRSTRLAAREPITQPCSGLPLAIAGYEKCSAGERCICLTSTLQEGWRMECHTENCVQQTLFTCMSSLVMACQGAGISAAERD